jgi:hypothetical protein
VFVAMTAFLKKTSQSNPLAAGGSILSGTRSG